MKSQLGLGALVFAVTFTAACLDAVPPAGAIEPGAGSDQGSASNSDGGTAPSSTPDLAGAPSNGDMATTPFVPDLIFPDCAQSTCWYVDNSATGTANGTSWQNAWSSFASIGWSQIHAGDTLFISGGASTQTYNEGLTIGGSGSAALPLYVRVGQDAGHNGVVTIGGTLSLLNRNYVIIDGGYAGQRHLVVSSGHYVEASQTVDPKIRYVDVSGTGIGINATYGSGGEFAYSYIHNITTDAAIRMNARNNNLSQYDQTFIHHNEIQVNSMNNSGTGPDGIQTGWGVSFYNNHMYGKVGTVTGGEHQDLIQTYGTQYLKVYNNLFENGGDSMIGCGETYSSGGHKRIWNNVFRTTTGSGTTAIRFYGDQRTINGWEDILIDSNTFVDLSLQSNYGAAIQFAAISGAASATNVTIRNNLFYNCGRAYQVVQIRNTAAGINIDYNLLNAGAHGNTNILYDGFGGQAHGQTGAPQFASYAEGANTNDFHLSATDSAARDKGQSLTGFSTDKEGIARPQAGAWDIGAFEGAL